MSKKFNFFWSRKTTTFIQLIFLSYIFNLRHTTTALLVDVIVRVLEFESVKPILPTPANGVKMVSKLSAMKFKFCVTETNFRIQQIASNGILTARTWERSLVQNDGIDSGCLVKGKSYRLTCGRGSRTTSLGIRAVIGNIYGAFNCDDDRKYQQNGLHHLNSSSAWPRFCWQTNIYGNISTILENIFGVLAMDIFCDRKLYYGR